MRNSIRLYPRPTISLDGIDRRYFHPGELERLVALIEAAHPEVVVEFGCNDGRAARAILQNVAGIDEYVGVDVLPGYQTHMACQRREVPARPGHLAEHDARFRVILRARGSFDLRWTDLPRCHAIFIDADHSRLGVLNDFALAMAIIRPGGIIVFHDDNGRPVVQVSETLDELAAGGLEVYHVAETWLAFTRT